MNKQKNVRLTLKQKTTGTVIGVGTVEKVEIPAGNYDMTLFQSDGCLWLAYKQRDKWVGKTLGDWAAYISANPPGTTTLTLEVIEEILKAGERPLIPS
jgi:hypothetical protein